MSEPKYKNDFTALYKVKQGDLKAYRFLFDSYFSDLCNFLKIYLHNQNLAEEVALDIFTNLWEKREELKINSSFKGYLFQSAKFKAISFLRNERKNIFTEFDICDLPDIAEPIHHSALETEELRNIIDEAINKLPEKSRIIYKMAWEEKLPHKLIADKLGISPKTVENQVGIALKKLRYSLTPSYEKIFILCLFFMSR